MHLERFGSLENVLKTKMELSLSLPQSGHLYLPESIKPTVSNFPLKVTGIFWFKNISDVYAHLIELLGLDTIKSKEILRHPPVAEHRRQVTTNGTMTIIDDTYNSNPAGFELALNELKSLNSPNKILVTPGMIELGSLQASENTRLAALAGSICQHIVIVGQTNKEALLLGLNNSPATVHTIDNLDETQTLLPSITTPHTAVLFENDLGDNYL
jgi:UDP-N-acetylmuramoyl-tripeptide--D-alanyl-D-alanine ligase